MNELEPACIKCGDKCRAQEFICSPCVQSLRTHGQKTQSYDSVDHPAHYTSHPSGVECIDVTEHMGFCLGNAMKYLWRVDLKNGLEDLKKARWYLDREIERRERQ